MIKVVFVDIDNTLLDFDKCAKVAMKYCMDQFGVIYEEKLYETFLEVNDSLWLEIERGELTRQGLYEIRWNRIFNRLGINIDGVEFEKRFVAVLENCAEPVDGAMKMLEYLASKYTVYAASNAPYEQQINRLKKSGMLKYITKVFTSEKIGFSKPSADFFDGCFADIEKIDRSEVILIGDSLTADISGGASYGLKTCWYNPANNEDEQNRADYVVNSLNQVKNFL